MRPFYFRPSNNHIFASRQTAYISPHPFVFRMTHMENTRLGAGVFMLSVPRMSVRRTTMDRATLEAMLEAADLPHCAVALVDSGGLRYAHACGVADRSSPAPMTSATIIQIASWTKAIVSAAALKLVEDGRLALHADAGVLLPELADSHVLTGFSPDGQPITRAAKGPITLHHLLTHTAGFSYAFARTEIQRLMLLESDTKGRLAAITQPLLFDPGERWEYGISLDWVGQLIEAATGASLGTYLEEELFGPLGMKDTAFRDALPAGAAKVHARRDEGGFRPVSVYLGGGPFQSGGAGLTSTVLDFARFVTMILTGGMFEGRRVLTAETVARLCGNQIGGIRAGLVESAMPELVKPFELFPGVASEWTYGFLRLPADLPHGPNAGTLSWAALFNGYFWIDRAANLGGVFATQLLPFGDEAALDTYARLQKAAYA
jgi:CubicO group peptidase (beta-lactamase class C family)